MYNLFCRIYQFIFRIAAYVLPWRRPVRLGGMREMAELFNRKGIKSVLLVTDAGLVSLGLHKEMTEVLNAADIQYAIFDKTTPNPTIANIEEARMLYLANHCQGIIALGGGSPMDCAKGVGARIARPKKTITQMKGQLKILKKIPLFVAIPTTAGTGSETTLAAVITDEKTHEKYAINDHALIAHYTVLEPELTKKLPPFITAQTGMDALVHAVEAYIGGSNTRQTREDALVATRLIFKNLYIAFTNGENLAARKDMQMAAYYAGAAFTRAYVGNIHAIAHTLGGQYGTPHGLANAVIMPYVLEAYGPLVDKQLAQLADAAEITTASMSTEDKAKAFIMAIRDMNRKMGIPDKLNDLKAADIPLLAKRALREANPLYPVPKIFNRQDMENIYALIRNEDNGHD